MSGWSILFHEELILFLPAHEAGYQYEYDAQHDKQDQHAAAIDEHGSIPQFCNINKRVGVKA